MSISTLVLGHAQCYAYTMKQQLTEEEQEKLKGMYSAGKDPAVIARRFKIHRNTVYSFLHRLGVPLRRPRKDFLDEVILTAVKELYAKGLSYRQISEETGIGEATLRKYAQKAGLVSRPPGFRRGEEHHAWKGGRHIPKDGYVRVWVRDDEPFFCMAQEHSAHGGYVLEHRLVMAKKLGRPLFEYETVHHKDLNGKNNDPDNLQLRVGKHGKGAAFQCIDCGSFNIEALSLEVPH